MLLTSTDILNVLYGPNTKIKMTGQSAPRLIVVIRKYVLNVFFGIYHYICFTNLYKQICINKKYKQLFFVLQVDITVQFILVNSDHSFSKITRI